MISVSPSQPDLESPQVQPSAAAANHTPTYRASSSSTTSTTTATPSPSSSSSVTSTTSSTTSIHRNACHAGTGRDIIFRSKLPDISIPNHLPLHTYCFQQSLQSHSAHRTCLIVGSTGHSYSYAETHLICRKTAAGLSNLGISRGDVIMILLPNCPEFVFTFMGASMIGAVTTTANPFYTPSEILKQFKASGARLIITQANYVHKLREFHELSSSTKVGEEVAVAAANASNGRKGGGLINGKDFTVITVDEPPEDCLHFSVLSESNIKSQLQSQSQDDDDEHVDQEEAAADHASRLLGSTTSMQSRIMSTNSKTKATLDFNPDDPVALPFSSGTTGLPKGVELTHRSLITSMAQQVDGENPNLHLRGDDVVLCVLPLFHIYSLNSVLLCSLRAGSAVLLMHKFEIGALLELMQRHNVSVAAVVPPLVLALAKNPMVEGFDLSSLRVILSGAAPLGKDLEDALRARVPQALLGQGYGMTEAGPVLSMCLGFAKQPFPTKSGSCGTVVRNAELKVYDLETGSNLGYNQPGEICIRGQQIMKGYLNDPEATARTIDVEGWLHTGDIGYVDEDDEVFIVDRVKEIIKFKGFQVPPAELEALLVSHASIADAAVVPQKDEAAGEVPVAFVVRTNGMEVTEEAIKEYIDKQVVFYKRLHKVYFVHAIPKSPSGKILRKDLRAKLAAASSTT